MMIEITIMAKKNPDSGLKQYFGTGKRGEKTVITKLYKTQTEAATATIQLLNR